MDNLEDIDTLQYCLRKLLGPLARFCNRHSIGIQVLTFEMQRAMVEAAALTLEEKGEKVNVMRLSAATGINRKLISKLWQKQAEPKSACVRGISARVIGQWLEDLEFRQDQGLPAPLTFKGTNNQFSSLVNKVTKELSPRSVLLHLEQARCVELKDGFAYLLKSAFDSGGDCKETFETLEEDLDDLFYAVEENLFQRQPVPNLHMTTEADEVPVSEAPELKAWLLHQGVLFHQKVRRKLATHDRGDRSTLSGKEECVRIMFHTFSRVENSQFTKQGE